MARCRVSGRQLSLLSLLGLLLCTAVNHSSRLSQNQDETSSETSASHGVRGRTATEEYNANKAGQSTEYKSLEQPPIEESPLVPEFVKDSPGDVYQKKEPSTSGDHDQLLIQDYPVDKPLQNDAAGEDVEYEDQKQQVADEDPQAHSIILESVQPEHRGIDAMVADDFSENEVSKDNRVSMEPVNQLGKDHSEDSMDPANEEHVSNDAVDEKHVSNDAVDEKHSSMEPLKEKQSSNLPVKTKPVGLQSKHKKAVVAKKHLQKTEKTKQKTPLAKQTSSQVSEVSTEGSVSSASPYSVPFVYSPPCYLCRTEICPNNGTSLKVVILVTSAPSHFEQRLTVRRTWGSFSQRKDVKVAFVLGKTDNETLIYKVLHETEVYGDVVIGDFMDAYQNLTLKTMFLLQFASRYCAHAKFVLKTDDDVFIHVENLLQLLSRNTDKKYGIWGVSHNKLTPHRNKKDKYFVPKSVFSGDKYPLFFAGPAYVMTKDTVIELQKNAEGCDFFPLEDVFFTGIVAERIKIPKYKTKAMKVSKKKIKYNMKEVISIHGQSRKEMFKSWNSIVSDAGAK